MYETTKQTNQISIVISRCFLVLFRLKDYPSYCQHLTAIPHFRQFPQHLIEYVEYGTQSQEPPPLATTTTRSMTPVNAGLSLLGQGFLGMQNLPVSSTTLETNVLTSTTPIVSNVAITTPMTTATTSAPPTTVAAKPPQPIPKVQGLILPKNIYGIHSN